MKNTQLLTLLTLAGLSSLSLGCPNQSVTTHASPPAFRIEGVALSPATMSLNVPPSEATVSAGYTCSGTFTATVKASDQATHSVTWKSSDSDRVTVLEGAVQTVAGAAAGEVVITATSVDDPAQFATATVSVSADGDLAMTIR